MRQPLRNAEPDPTDTGERRFIPMKPWLLVLAISAVWITFTVIALPRGDSQTHLNPNQLQLPLPGGGAVIRAEALVSQSPDGSYLIPIPVPPPGTNQQLTVQIWAIQVARNGALQNAGTDFHMDPGNAFRFLTGVPWLPTDSVVVDYWSGVSLPAPLPATGAKPITGSRLGRWLRREYPGK